MATFPCTYNIYRLKSLLQLMAAAVAGRDVVYFTFGDSKLQKDLSVLHCALVKCGVTVGQVSVVAVCIVCVCVCCVARWEWFILANAARGICKSPFRRVMFGSSAVGL